MTDTVFIIQESADGTYWYDAGEQITEQDGRVTLARRRVFNDTFVQPRKYRLVRRETTEEELPSEIPTPSTI
jgi:hypothetical protein